MKLSVKLFSAMGALTAIILVLGLFSLYQMSGISKATQKLAQLSMPNIAYMGNISTMVSDFRQTEILHIYSENMEELDRYDRRMADVWKNLIKELDSYSALPRTPEEDTVYQVLSQSLTQYYKLSEQSTNLSRKLQTQDAIKLLLGDSQKVYDTLANSINRITVLNIEQGDGDAAQAENAYTTAQQLIFTLLGLSLLAAIALSIFIVRGVLRQLGVDPGDLMNMARSVAEGNLDIRTDKKAVGVYAHILTMVESLKTYILNAQDESRRAKEESDKAQVSMLKAEEASAQAKAKSETILQAAERLGKVADIVSSASTQLSAQITQSSRGASEQSARMAETATAMNEMNATVMEVAKNAGSAFDVSTATREKAENGANIVSKAVSSIRQVQADSMVLKKDMSTLSDHAQAITQIMSVISDIADQTNLLALNAAIEAARAGDAGRGFAVVADEVRNLAEKTMASTTDVSNAIKAIQTSAHKSMAQVDVAVKNIEEATTFANESGASLEEIVHMVDQTADQVRAIAAASEQQSAASEEINHAISQVNSIAGETAQAMNQASSAVSDLSRQANDLTRLIDELTQA